MFDELAHSGQTFQQDFKWLAMSEILPPMRPEWFECYWSAVRIVKYSQSLLRIYLECRSLRLSMSKTFGQATRMCPNIWIA